MSQEMLIKDLVESLSNERDLEQSVVFGVVEEALADVTQRQLSEAAYIRVNIDPKTGHYDTYRRWRVVPDDTDWSTLVDEEGDAIEATRCMLLSEAQAHDPEITPDMYVEAPIESIQFGRIAAQQAKHVIMQKVREAERKQIALRFQARIGELITGVVKRVTREFIILDLGNHIEAVLDRQDAMPRESFHINDRVRAILSEIRPDTRGPQLRLSRTTPQLLIELFKLEVPEISEEVIEIRHAARDPGARAKIAVKTNDNRLDPVGACVGMRGSRVQAVSNELKGERIDIILWDSNPVQLVINAMAPAEIASIMVDEEKRSMDLSVTEEQLAQAIGRGGQNVRLASRLSDWTLNVMTEAEAQHKHKQETQSQMSKLIEALDIDEEVAELLVNDGFTSTETIAYVEKDELTSIEGFDQEIAEELQSRAKELIAEREKAAEAILANAKPAEDLLAVDGITERMARQLASQDIITRDDLAELATDELQKYISIDNEQAAKLIMAARAHWFDEDAS